MTETERQQKTARYEAVLKQWSELDKERTALAKELREDFADNYYRKYGVKVGDRATLMYNKNAGNRHMTPQEGKIDVVLGNVTPDMNNAAIVTFRRLRANGEAVAQNQHLSTHNIYDIRKL